MGLFNFWKKKAETLNLEKLVEMYTDLKKEFEDLKGLISIPLPTLSKRHVGIIYVPNTELKVVVNGEEYNSKDTTKELYQELVNLYKEDRIDDMVNKVKVVTPRSSTSEELKRLEGIKDSDIQKAIEDTISLIRANEDFEVKGNSVYLKGIDRSLPQAMIDKFLQILTDNEGKPKAESVDFEEYEAWRNYWYWIVLNPNTDAANRFFSLMQKYNVQVSKEGFILGYRWLVLLDEGSNKELSEFISNEWTKYKKWKKSPKNFNVVEVETVVQEEEGYWEDPNDYDENEDYEPDSEYYVTQERLTKKEYKVLHVSSSTIGRVIGNLDDLYTHLSESSDTVYTDGYTGTMRIKIGEEVEIPRSECDESNNECSRGLHNCFRLSDHHGDNSGQSVKVLTAICPRDIVSVPYINAGSSKFRSCKYMPLAVLKDNEDENFIVGSEGLEILEKYSQAKLEELKEEAEKNTVKEMTAHRLIPAISEQDLKSAIDFLSNRIVQIV